MDFGLAGTMRMNIAESDTRHDSMVETTSRGEIDEVEMLEAEIENLTLELEREKESSAQERAATERHIEELSQARTGISCFQQLLKEKTSCLSDAEVEIASKNKQLADAEQELTQGRSQIEQLKRELVERQNAPIRPLTHSTNSFNTSEERTEQTELRSKVDALTTELHACQRELGSKSKEMETLRGYLRGMEPPRRTEPRRLVQEDESEMAKQMKIKDAMISRITVQMEELRAKNKQIPQIHSQATKFETVIATLKTQRTTLNERLKEKTKLFEQKERIMNERVVKLENTITTVEAQASSAKSSFERDLHDMKSKMAALEREVKGREEQIAQLTSESSYMKQDYEHRITSTESELARFKRTQVAETAKVEKSLKSAKRAQTSLKDENKKLRRQIAYLGQNGYSAGPTQANQNPELGIVFCVDLSSSLAGAPETDAKTAFKQLVAYLQARYPNTYVGIVVQATSIYVVREISAIWSAHNAILDSIPCGGSEDYTRALPLVSALFEKFDRANPDADMRVIMISDGEGGSRCEDVSAIGLDMIPYHNVVIDKGGSDCNTCSTALYSSESGGQNILFKGSFSASDFELLLAP